MSTPFRRTVLTRDAIVLGGGVSGLSTAIRLLEAEFKVRVVTRDRTPNTTSDVAAAVWYPSPCGAPDRALLWSRRTFRALRAMAQDPVTGVRMVQGVDLLDSDDGSGPWWKDATDALRRAAPDELAPGFPAGLAFVAPVAAMPVYMRWLETRVEALGGAIETRTVTKLESLLLEASLVVNCAGLGARELVKDDTLHPVRGQIVRVAPGHADRFLQAGGTGTPLTYIVPRPDCTVLGGTEEEGVFDVGVDPAAAEAILARCIAIEPALRTAAVLSHAVGLRPGRSEVRLETVRSPGGVIIHNYGHGGSGVTLSWGCADEVARRASAEIPR